MALFNYLCVFRISLAVQRRTPLEIRQKFSDIAIYASVSNCVFGRQLGCLAPVLASYIPLCSVSCAKGEPLRLCFQLAWLSTSVEKAETDCHNKRKLVSDLMTVLNDGPFITMAEVFTA